MEVVEEEEDLEEEEGVDLEEEEEEEDTEVVEGEVVDGEEVVEVFLHLEWDSPEDSLLFRRLGNTLSSFSECFHINLQRRWRIFIEITR